MDHLCFLCVVFLMLLRLLIAALWSPAGKGLTSKALVGDVYCIFVTFPCGILRQVWYLYLIVSFPDLCLLNKISRLYIEQRNYLSGPVV